MTDSRFTSTALGAIRSAQENAARLGHSYVGSEHLLLGLASLEYSPAAQALRRAGADRKTLRAGVVQRVGVSSAFTLRNSNRSCNSAFVILSLSPLLKLIFCNRTVFYTKCCKFFIGHLVKIRMHHPGDSIMRHQNISLL